MTFNEYVGARRVLLDALQALQPHLDALILVGAQAVYQHTGDSGIAVAPTTTDANLAIDAFMLSDDPNLPEALRAAGFELHRNPGTWKGAGGVAVDLMVPAEQLAGAGGRRSARLGPHGNEVARKTSGLEPALVDNSPIVITSLEPVTDQRAFTLKVAGPTALLIAKLTKISERMTTPSRLQPKDGLDVLRILQSTEVETLAGTLRTLLADDLSGTVTAEAIGFLRSDGVSSDGVLTGLAVRATMGLEDSEFISRSVSALVEDLVEDLDSFE